jgi:uncharacterized RDD family membrane protein YckC
VSAAEELSPATGATVAGTRTGPAGVVTRGLALALDAALVVVALIVGVLVTAVVVDLVRFQAPRFPQLHAGTWRLVSVLAFCAYNVLGWWLFGQTAGKALLGVRVETKNGRPLPLWRACLRMLCYPLSALLLGLGFAIAAVTPQRRALHDLIAGTRVVYTK